MAEAHAPTRRRRLTQFGGEVDAVLLLQRENPQGSDLQFFARQLPSGHWELPMGPVQRSEYVSNGAYHIAQEDHGTTPADLEHPLIKLDDFQHVHGVDGEATWNQIWFAYLSTWHEGDPEHGTDPTEFPEVGWFTVAQLRAMNISWATAKALDKYQEWEAAQPR